MNQEYERKSHTHCWDQNGNPPCGQPIESHKQCCLCDTPQVATSERKNCECGMEAEEICHHTDKPCHPEVPTPPESEDWGVEFNKNFIGNKMLDLFGSKGTPENLRDFIRQEKSKSYQRGREEVIEIAVQEIEKEKLKVGMFGATDEYDKMLEEENEKFNEGLDKALEKLEGLKK